MIDLGPIEFQGTQISSRAPMNVRCGTSVDTVPAGGAVIMSVRVNDPEGDRLTYTWSSSCADSALTQLTATAVSWRAPRRAGTCWLQVSAENSAGASCTCGVEVLVEPPAHPAVETIEPGAAQAGEIITIAGSGFSPWLAPVHVWFGDIEAQPAQTTDGSISVQVPAGLPGTDVAVRVETEVGMSAPAPFLHLGNRVYVRFADGIAAIDVVRQQTVGRVALPDDAGEVLISADGRTLYALNSYLGDLSVIETIGMTEVATVGLGRRPRNMTITADGAALLVANYGGNTVDVVDLSAGSPAGITVIASIETGANPYKIELSADGMRAFVLNMRDHSISEIDLDPASSTYLRETHETILPIGYPSDLLLDGDTAVVANQSMSTAVSSADLALGSAHYGQVLASAPAAGPASRLLRVPGTDRVYVSVLDVEAERSVIARFDLGSSSLASTSISLHRGARSMTYAEASGELLVTSGPSWEDTDGGEIFFIGVAPGEELDETVRAVLLLPSRPGELLSLPGSGLVAVAGGANDSVYFIDVMNRVIISRVEVGLYAERLVASAQAH